jgi:hypothetical protein
VASTGKQASVTITASAALFHEFFGPIFPRVIGIMCGCGRRQPTS